MQNNSNTEDFTKIIRLIKDKMGYDFSGYRSSMLMRLLDQRVRNVKCKDLQEYMIYIESKPDEIYRLFDLFTINVSRFFRNSMVYEILEQEIIPILNTIKRQNTVNEIRVWSAGCAAGEEPYSVAILFHEYSQKNHTGLPLLLFASDIDGNAVKKALKAVYPAESLEETKLGRINRYFLKVPEGYKLKEQVKQMVNFYEYDLLDKNSYTLPASIYGSFDIVLCRNVLIYFEPQVQRLIFDKLYKSLNPGGFLILGEAELPVEGFTLKIISFYSSYRIYRKPMD